jgi:hypothetical protein
MALHVDEQGQVNRFFDHLFVLPDFYNDAIQVNDGINRIQGAGLPLNNLVSGRIDRL